MIDRRSCTLVASLAMLTQLCSPVGTTSVQAQNPRRQANSDVILRPGTILATLRIGDQKIISASLGATDSAGSGLGGAVFESGIDLRELRLMVEGDREYLMSARDIGVEVPGSGTPTGSYSMQLSEPLRVAAHQESDLSDVTPLSLEFDTRDLQVSVTVSQGVIKDLYYKFNPVPGSERSLSGRRSWGNGTQLGQAHTGILPVQVGVDHSVQLHIVVEFPDGSSVARGLEPQMVLASEDVVSWDVVVEPEVRPKASFVGSISVTGTDVATTRGSIDLQKGYFSVEDDMKYEIGNLDVGPINGWISTYFSDGGEITTGIEKKELVEGVNEYNHEVSVLESKYRVGYSSVRSEVPDRCWVELKSPLGASSSASYRHDLAVSEGSVDVPLKLTAGDWTLYRLESRFESDSSIDPEYRAGVQHFFKEEVFQAQKGAQREGPSFQYSSAVVTFDVQEPPGALEEVEIANPRIQGSPVRGSDWDKNPGPIYGWSKQRGKIASLRIWGVPNQSYDIDATATVGGGRISFARSQIRFYEPEFLDVGPQKLVLSGSEPGKCRRAELSYDEIEVAGNGVVTPLPLGAKPPQGYSVYSKGRENSTPEYYNVNLSAIPSEASKVDLCIWFDPEAIGNDDLSQKDLRLGQFVAGAQSQADCPSGTRFVGKGWCDLRVEGSGSEAPGEIAEYCGEEVDHLQVICGKTDARSLSDAAILVPDEAGKPVPGSELNCTAGDVVVDGEVVDPIPGIQNQYDAGVRLGRRLAALIWFTVATDDPSSVENFARRANAFADRIRNRVLRREGISDAGKCRLRGITQGVADFILEVVP